MIDGLDATFSLEILQPGFKFLNHHWIRISSISKLSTIDERGSFIPFLDYQIAFYSMGFISFRIFKRYFSYCKLFSGSLQYLQYWVQRNIWQKLTESLIFFDKIPLTQFDSIVYLTKRAKDGSWVNYNLKKCKCFFVDFFAHWAETSFTQIRITLSTKSNQPNPFLT